jgi:hypothetical protein
MLPSAASFPSLLRVAVLVGVRRVRLAGEAPAAQGAVRVVLAACHNLFPSFAPLAFLPDSFFASLLAFQSGHDLPKSLLFGDSVRNLIRSVIFFPMIVSLFSR